MELIAGILLILIAFWLFSDDIETSGNIEHKFASTLTRFGDPTAPERIIISDKLVTWKKNRGLNWLYLNSDSISIPRKNIDSVIIHNKLIGCRIEITGLGQANIMANNFRAKDAVQIRDILLS